jgi:stress response protein SCP2
MSTPFARGQKSKLSDLEASLHLKVQIQMGSLEADVSCFGLDDQSKLLDDRYFVFFNQPQSPEGAIKSTGNGMFSLELDRLPNTVRRLMFTATLDKGSMSQLSSGALILSDASGEKARFEFRGSDFAQEKALMIAEIYFKDVWRFAAVGQGFNGGLQKLLEHFGGQALEAPAPAPVATPRATPVPAAPVPVAPPASSSGDGKINLIKQKRIDLDKKLEREAPAMVSLIKKATISLEKKGLSDHRAKVGLCLDISGSMHGLYQSGKIQRLAEKVLALGTRFDDDFSIDIFLFGLNAHDAGSMDPNNFKNFVGDLLRNYPLEGGTHYAPVMRMVRNFYFRGGGKVELPTYLLFLTDGDAQDKDQTRREVLDSSREGIFWQFVGIGKSNKATGSGTPKKKGFWASLLASDFGFLEELDDMTGRLLDNADFFSVEDPEAIPDQELYDLMLGEYAGWVPQARAKNLIF